MIGQLAASCGVVFGLIGAFAILPAYYFNRRR